MKKNIFCALLLSLFLALSNHRPITKAAGSGLTGSGAKTTIYFHHPDHLGSASLTTNTAGDKVSEVRYYPYGSVRKEEGSFKNDYKYNDKELDDESGLIYYGARYYDPRIGRWISNDPLQRDVAAMVKLNELNGYAYTKNNPLKYVDPTGSYPVLSEITDFTHDSYAVSAARNFEGEKSTYEAVIYMTETYGGEIGSKGGNPNRYAYFEEGGWIDLQHFFAAAEMAYYDGYESTISWGELVEAGQEIINEYAPEGWFEKSKNSAYSFEDLTSNVLGAYFGAYYLKEKTEAGLSYSEALEQFFSAMGGVSIDDAKENYSTINVEDYGDWILPEGYTKEEDHPKRTTSSTNKEKIDKRLGK